MAGAHDERDVREVRVHSRPRRHNPPTELEEAKAGVPKMAARNSNYVYVNSAFVGSTNSVSQSRYSEPPTSVIREQYWACSKWPHGQRILAIAVGILLGAVIGLAVAIVLLNSVSDDGVGGIFRSQPVPD